MAYQRAAVKGSKNARRQANPECPAGLCPSCSRAVPVRLACSWAKWGRERLGSVAAGTDRGSGAGFAGQSGHSDLGACCYGDGMEGLRCKHGILRTSLFSLCLVLRQIPVRGGPIPPLGPSFCILPSCFCLQKPPRGWKRPVWWTGHIPPVDQSAVYPDWPMVRWS